MFLAIPVRTESATRRVPVMNLTLIAVNIAVFIALDPRIFGESAARAKHQIFALQAIAPQFYQFFTYQFMHESWPHLLSNMLFLWVFGNSVNGKMGHGPYLFFYLAGGVFAGWGNSLFSPNSLIGASGAIAAVTTAYLALFPRSHVTVLVWLFIFIQFFELPAMLIIVIKVILWDNIISPGMGEADNIAYNAHLAGYLFGFTATLLMLMVRSLPRDQFDILAVWRRWHQRGGLAHVFGAGPTPEQYTYGKVARTPVADPEERAAEDRYVNEVAEMRGKIVAALDAGNLTEGADIYQKLVALAPTQCMSEREQLQIARELYRQSRFEQAAFAFERFLECYRDSDEAGNVRLLLGIIYARDLRQFEAADKHLTQSMVSLRDQSRRGQCLQWLTDVRAALGRPAPDIING